MTNAQKKNSKIGLILQKMAIKIKYFSQNFFSYDSYAISYNRSSADQLFLCRIRALSLLLHTTRDSIAIILQHKYNLNNNSINNCIYYHLGYYCLSIVNNKIKVILHTMFYFITNYHQNTFWGRKERSRASLRLYGFASFSSHRFFIGI
jgi:hypothetical protein